MTCSYYGNLLLSRSFEYGSSQVLIPFIDQNLLYHGKFLCHFLHKCLEGILVLQLFKLFRSYFLIGECGRDERCKQLALIPERALCPCPFERGLDIPVTEGNGNSCFLCYLSCSQYFLSGLSACLGTHPALEGCKGSVC